MSQQRQNRIILAIKQTTEHMISVFISNRKSVNGLEYRISQQLCIIILTANQQQLYSYTEIEPIFMKHLFIVLQVPSNKVTNSHFSTIAAVTAQLLPVDQRPICWPCTDISTAP